MKQIALTLFIALLVSTNIFAQRDETVLSKTKLRLTGAWGGPVIGTTFYDGDNKTIAGGFAGVEFNKEFFVGWRSQFFDYQDGLLNSTRKFAHNSLLLGYTPAAHKVVHPKIELAIGSATVEQNGIKNDSKLMLQPSAGIEVNVLRWFRVGADVGYRYVDGGETGIYENTSNFFGELKFKFGLSWGKSDKYKRERL